uniref:6-phosphogluconate dehydrogenase n=1 Tax=Geobacter metallireducens TaxID=28232 RepID=A0A831XF86_GEOME
MPFSKAKVVGWLIGAVVLVLVLIAGYTWFSLTWTYSRGERAGYVQKFSKKGWIFKTWEGELQMLPVPGAIPEKFLFSVRDETVAQKINNSVGKKVVLRYGQHKGVPSTIFAETEFFVEDVKVLE